MLWCVSKYCGCVSECCKCTLLSAGSVVDVSECDGCEGSKCM